MDTKHRIATGGAGRGVRQRRSTARSPAPSEPPPDAEPVRGAACRLAGMVPRAWLVVVLAAAAASTTLPAAAQDCCYCTQWQVEVWSFSAHDTCDFNGSECACDLTEDQDECQANCLMSYNLGDLDCNGGSFEYAGRRTYTTCTHLTDINASCNGTRSTGIPAGSCLEGDPECRCPADLCAGTICTGGKVCTDGACACVEGRHGHQGASACHAREAVHTYECPANQHLDGHSLSTCHDNHMCPNGQELYDHDKCDPWPENGCPGRQVMTAGGACASQCPNGQSDGDDDGVCTVDDIYPDNGCPGRQVMTAGGACASRCPDGQSDGDGDGVCTVDDPWPDNGCPGTQVDRDPRPGTVVCSSSCRPNARVVQSTGVCACDHGYELDSIGRCVANIYPDNGCDIAGRVNRNGNCDYTGCGSNADIDRGRNGYCVCAADYRYPNETTLHCSPCADGLVPNGRVCVACATDHAETSAGSCTACGPGEVPSSDGSACEACGPGRAEKTAGSCTTCASGSEPDAARTACRPCAADHAGTDGICMRCGPNRVPNPGRNACGDCPDGESGSEPDAARTACRPCAADHAGTDGICMRCGPNRVPNPGRSACGDCPDGETETSPGVCTGGGTEGGTEGGTGHCTTLGNHYPGDEARCAPHGLVSTNGRCELAECPVNSTDDGAGVCVCAPGHVYDNGQPGLHGTTYNYPRTCTGRTVDLCGAAPDPGTCGPGGTWNSGRAVCDCGDGFERSDDGRSCVCADDGAEQTGYLASVLFPNPQSLFDGLRVGFVNTSSGNLTFRRRDIVTRAQGPVVFARVYDSRIAANYDFGPGWRLSLAEELLVDGDAATYIDESGARHAFAQTGTAWTASPPTPRHAATMLDFADVDDIRVAVLADGATVRTFEQADAASARYVVRLVRTPARELVFDYDGGRLAAVSHDGTTLFEVERDGAGRIAEVRDDHGRSVHYAYDAGGRLETARDIAGSDWRYLYRDDGLLGGAVDPEGRTYLAAAYDDATRVARAYGGRLHEYAYAPEGTTVAEDTGEVHALTRNAAGATTALSSTTGDSWSLTLDGANRVSTLTLPGRTIDYAYGGHGKVATMTVADSGSGTTRVHSYDSDAQDRLVAVSGGGADATVTYAAGTVRIEDGGEVFEYEIDDRGRVASMRRATEPEIRAERDGAGNIVAVSQGFRSVLFDRDTLGRIVHATYAHGLATRYFYDDLGRRVLAERGDGRSVAYAYDATGSMTGIEETQRNGTVREWTASDPPNPAGVVDHDGFAAVDTDPHATAKVPEFEVSENPMTARFDGRSTFASMAGAPRPEERSPNAERASEPAPRTTTPAAAAMLLGERQSRRQPDYGMVVFERGLAVSDWNPLTTGVPRIADTRVLLGLATPLLALAADDGFDEPSSPVFQPPEYAVDGASTTLATDEGDTCPVERPCNLKVIIGPSSPAISTTPAMPAITATARNVSPTGATLAWSAQISYTPPTGDCSTALGTSFDSNRVTGSGTSFSPSFNGIYGGQLTITATCTASDHAEHTASNTVTINGTQPSDSQITAQMGMLGSPFDSVDLRRIACKESPGLLQFDPSPGPPNFGNGDVGIMQICFRRTVADVWNWRSNIERGRSILTGDSLTFAKKHLDKEAAEEGATPYATQYLREEAIHRYNAGTDGVTDAYRVWTPAQGNNPGMWEVVDNGGIGGYVSDVLGKSATCRR